MDTVLILEWFLGLLPNLYFLLALVVLDLIGGVLIAILNKSFLLEKIADFVKSATLKFWAYLTVSLLAALPNFFGVEVKGFGDLLVEYSDTVIYGAIVLGYLASILGHLASVGIPKLPNVVKYVGVEPTAEKYSNDH